MKLSPSKVIFVDDEFEHVQSVVTCLEKLGIDCLGIHYTAVSDMPCELNHEQARFQINHFIQHDVWLNDHASKNLFQSSN